MKPLVEMDSEGWDIVCVRMVPDDCDESTFWTTRQVFRRDLVVAGTVRGTKTGAVLPADNRKANKLWEAYVDQTYPKVPFLVG